eukprot:CAMPEP_0178732860 /NCGR_PEP_ID=MMETSP0744-20121128/487_1 /TAXON_ID=913974 /ORGANISM="Nitzschia punctata, Strain CCMP561" /LENGTH=246 /DNA_ID=CAMNT_0020385005 /DNA_START=53 /DNA_END=793 /DNA_ORIENTATION=+
MAAVKEPPRISRKRSLCDISCTVNPQMMPVEKPFVRIISRHSAPAKKKSSDPDVRPHVFLLSLLQSKGVDAKVYPCQEVSDFFLKPSQNEIDAYGFEVLSAVRNQDIKLLGKFHKEGRPLKCSNQFGESLLHLACRKSFAGVVRFLVQEAGVPFNVKDDFGRNPAHDACWTISPNFELVDLIVEKCPDLFFIEDVRGHTPLDYIRKEHWPVWIEYLSEKGTQLIPKNIMRDGTKTTASSSSEESST